MARFSDSNTGNGLTYIQETLWDDFTPWPNQSVKISPVADHQSILVQSDEQALLRYHVRDSNFDVNGFDVTGLDSYIWHTTTSTSPDFIDVLGLRTFTVDSTSFYTVGDYVKVWDAGDDTRWYSGTITALIADTSITINIDTLAPGADPAIETSLWKIYSATIVWAIGQTERILPAGYHYQMNGVMGFDGYYLVPSTTAGTVTMQYTNPLFNETWPADVQALDFAAENINAYLGVPSIYSQFRTRSNGAWIQNANWSENPTYYYDWHFKNDGSINFPYNTSNARTGSGEVLQFGNNNNQTIITGPKTDDTHVTATRLVVAGQDGFTGTTGEGGDIYLWAGKGGSAGGTGGDIKLDGGQGSLGGQGGTVKMRGGSSPDGTGGFVEIQGGSGTTGGYVDISSYNGAKITLSGDGGEFLNNSNVPNNQIATIGDLGVMQQIGKFYTSSVSHFVDSTWTGKHAYFTYDGNWDAIFLPDDASLNLPIGFTFTIITDQNEPGSWVYINANDTSLTELSAVGVGSNDSGYDISNNTMVTVMKIDSNRWIISGPGIQID
jgi:hypothetical protein